MRDYVDYSRGAEQLFSNVRQRAGLGALLAQRLGWTCDADATIEEALARQVEALTYERDAMKAEIASMTLGSRTSESGPAVSAAGAGLDEAARLHEIERTLRDAKADLEAARMRLGTLEWDDPLGDRKFTVEVLMKAGKRAL